MRWPWSRKPELRQSSYTDTLVTFLLSQAQGNPLRKPTATAAVEAAAGVVGRAFMAAEVKAPSWATQALSPALLNMVGRSLIRRGEIVLAIDMAGTALRLWPVADHDVTGGYDPDGWAYRLNLAGPSEQTTRAGVAAESVVHVQYAADPEEPWRGVGPIQAAALAGKLSAETVAALGDELAGPRGYVLPMPNTDGNDDSVTELKADLKKLSGQLALVESMTTAYNTATRRDAPADWEVRRIGARPPESIVMLADTATREILGACGISPALFDPKAAAAAREAYRQMLFSVIAPLGKIVEAELSKKLETAVKLTWAELRAADIQGRARAFQSLTGAGMEAAQATTLAGLDGL